jgi:hypothetical protein
MIPVHHAITMPEIAGLFGKLLLLRSFYRLNRQS